MRLSAPPPARQSSAQPAQRTARRRLHRLGGVAAAALTALLLAAGCKPIVRPAPFAGARDRVTDDSLLGPFDGQIVDATTGEPIREAVVVGVWSYDKGDGFIGPWGSETVLVSTDEAGRYRIGSPRVAVRGSSLRMVAFHLVAYRRGYEAYRSDALVGGGARHDFTVRHNRVELRKWRDSDSHADHLIFLAPPPEVAKVSRWERAQANLELYRRLGGERAVKLPPVGGTKAPPDGEPSVAQWLDARALLPPSEARLRTGDTEAFEVKDLADLERTAYYHGVHLQAAGRAEEWDITYRVWLDPPDGLDPVVETFGATLPDVPMSSEVMPETWVLDGAALRAVAFIDRKRKAGVLLTCGAQQCGDLDTAIILAKFIAGRLEMLTSVPAGEAAKPIPDAAKPEPETPETPETPEPEPEPEPEPAPKTAEDVEPETEPAPEDRR